MQYTTLLSAYQASKWLAGSSVWNLCPRHIKKNNVVNWTLNSQTLKNSLFLSFNEFLFSQELTYGQFCDPEILIISYSFSHIEGKTIYMVGKS